MRKVWGWVSLNGIDGDLQELVKNQVRLLNQLNFIGLIASLLAFFINLLIVKTDLTNSILLIAITLSSLLFIRQRKYHLSKLISGFIFPILIGLLMVRSDSNFAFTNLFLMNLAVISIIYEGELVKQFFSMLIHGLAGIVALLYIAQYKPNYHIDLNPYNDVIIFITAIISLIIIVSLYQRNILSAISVQTDLMSALKEKNLDLERFAYVTSHDLKEPVRNIESLSRFIRKSIDEPTHRDRNMEMIGMIKDSSNRMSELIDSILKYSKLDTEELPITEVNIEDIVQEFINTHTDLLENSNVRLVYNDLPAIKGNKTFISLLFQNLIENGFKYNSADMRVVKLHAQVKGKYHLFRVSDNGIGIGDEFKEYIFEPFKRLHDNQSFKGSGLGLSICKKIVEMHNGKIWLDNNETGGSTFQFTLPAA